MIRNTFFSIRVERWIITSNNVVTKAQGHHRRDMKLKKSRLLYLLKLIYQFLYYQIIIILLSRIKYNEFFS